MTIAGATVSDKSDQPSGPAICLAASGGGHLRQIFDLEPAWRGTNCFFVTEDTALGRSLAAREPVEFVPHFALGQARLGKPWAMLTAAWRSLTRSWRIVSKRRPDLVITTGAGSMVFVVLWARLRGARIVLVDSFARFDRPSAFARLAGPLAHVRIAQSARSARHWPGALVFDPLQVSDPPRPPKQPLLFATVGATLPFERLTRLVLDAKRSGLLPEEVILQTGEGAGAVEPVPGVTIRETLPFDEVRDVLARADLVVCHGGTGSLITALREQCRVIAVPRRFDLGEHYDDHQAEITEAFVARGLIDVADNDAGFAEALARARARTPRRASTEPGELVGFLKTLIERWPARDGTV